MLRLHLLKVSLDLFIIWLTISRLRSVLQCNFQLSKALAVRQSKGCLRHPKVCLNVAFVVIQNAFALVNHMVVVLKLELAHRKVAPICHLCILTRFRLRKVCIQAHFVDRREILGTSFLILLLLEQVVRLELEFLGRV